MKRLVLVGAGHAHLEVLRQAAKGRFRGAEILLISPEPAFHYSGMVPGYLQGFYAEPDLAIPLEPLARRAGARFVVAAADQVDVANRVVVVGGDRFGFDLVSLDVGAAAGGIEGAPGAAAHARTLRPMTNAIALRERMDELLVAMAHSGGPSRTSGSAQPRGRGAVPVPELEICVVGGGAAGIEISLALHRRAAEHGARCTIHLVERNAALIESFATRSRVTARRVLQSRDVHVRTNAAVVKVDAGFVALAKGARLPASITVWTAGSAPPALLAASDIPRDAGGYLVVDRYLRATDGSPVWGAGDCTTQQDHPGIPKGGVYAVRAAPILAANLAAALHGARPREHRPRAEALWLLNTADGCAILDWRGLSVHSRWAWWLKDRIDRRFVRRYQVLAEA